MEGGAKRETKRDHQRVVIYVDRTQVSRSYFLCNSNSPTSSKFLLLLCVGFGLPAIAVRVLYMYTSHFCAWYLHKIMYVCCSFITCGIWTRYAPVCCAPKSLTEKILYRKLGKNIPNKETARPQSQFLHSYICERFIYSHDRSAYLAAAK